MAYKRSKVREGWEYAESVLGHAIGGLEVDERYVYVSHEEIFQAVDSMTFDNGKTQVLVAHG